MDLRILALDQATTTGFAIMEYKNGKAELLEFGKKSFKGDTYTEKISKIKQWMAVTVEENDIDAVALEDTFFSRNTQTFKKLSGLLAVLSNWLYENNIQFLIVGASTWRSTCNIKEKKRADKKRASKELILNKFNQKVTDDESDAICIGIHTVEQLNQYQWGVDVDPIEITFNLKDNDL